MRKKSPNPYKKIIGVTFLVLILISCKVQLSNKKTLDNLSAIQNVFSNATDTVQTSIYWYWMSDNISKEGVIKDLHAMKSVGINRAFIGNIGYPTTPYGKVKIFSEEWWDILHTALKTATELNIEIGIFNSPGWSQSGGPWIKPEQSMRYLTSSETTVTGGKQIIINLPKPNKIFEDVKTIAYPLPKFYNDRLTETNTTVISSLTVNQLNKLIDRDTINDLILPSDKTFYVDFNTQKIITARSLVIYPAHFTMTADAEILALIDGKYNSIRKFSIDRRNDNLNVGFAPYGPIAISLPETESNSFKLVISNASSRFGISEVDISPSPRIESFTEKTLAKMFQSPLPYWNEYQWIPQPKVSDQSLTINPQKVLDLTKYLSTDGQLNWNAPSGDWIVLRTGMTTTGVTNGPASKEATGLEVDKMSKTHVESHFNSFLGEIIRRIPAEDRKTWKVAVQDSYETGGQNWTDGMTENFKKNYGYDPVPYLPTLSGKVVGNPEISDRFLWDLRRLIADRVAYDYVGGLKAVSHKNGLHTWLENYGHWGFPGEFLQYGGQSDEIGGEFWSEGELGNIENRAASSAAHIYGKTKVSAESFTAGGRPYIRYPGFIKQRGDRFFTEGINNTLLHVYIEQPTDEIVPGINANFSTEFNRHNTWFSYMDLFTTYLKRCNYLLQQGKYVADVAYFIGEDAPKMTGVCDPALPAGYSFDYINAEVLKNRVTVKNGRLFLPDGMNYGLLVLPKLETMRPELLKKIMNLVKQGAHVFGPPPSRSPSLQNFAVADQEVLQMAKLLWGNTNSKTESSFPYGKGTVSQGTSLQPILNSLKLKPDFVVKTSDPVLFIHRKLPQGDFYFISNQSNNPIAFNPQFRVEGKIPEIWDPITGDVIALPEFKTTDGATTLPLRLEALQSAFIVFKSAAIKQSTDIANIPVEFTLSRISTPWIVEFEKNRRGPVEPIQFNSLTDWTENSRDDIKYFSGTAIYRNSFISKSPKNKEHIFLNLGEVNVIAKVKVNGIYVGGAWTNPWRVEITKALKAGTNTVEISVANTWVNRLIGDSKVPEKERKTWTNDNPYKPDSKLEPSGLKGPVSISSITY